MATYEDSVEDSLGFSEPLTRGIRSTIPSSEDSLGLSETLKRGFMSTTLDTLEFGELIFYLNIASSITDYFTPDKQQDFITSRISGPRLFGWYAQYLNELEFANVDITNEDYLTLVIQASSSISYTTTTFHNVPFVYKVLKGNFDIEVGLTSSFYSEYLSGLIVVKNPRSSNNFILITGLSGGSWRVQNVTNGTAASGDIGVLASLTMRIERVGSVFNFYRSDGALVYTIGRSDFPSILEVGYSIVRYFTFRTFKSSYIRNIQDKESIVFDSFFVASELEELAPFIRIFETLGVIDHQSLIFLKTLSEVFEVSDALHLIMGVVITDLLYLSQLWISNQITEDAVSEILSNIDTTSFGKAFLTSLNESLSLEDFFGNVRDFLESVRENLRISEYSVGGLSTTKDLSDLLSLGELAFLSQDLDLVELLTIAEFVGLSAFLYSLAVSQIQHSDFTTYSYGVVNTDSWEASETVSTTGTLFMTLVDLLTLRMSINITVTDSNGLPYGEYQVWSFSTNKLLPSIYTDFDFTSFTTVGGVVYGTRSDGIYVLTDDSESGNIPTSVKIDCYNFGTNLKKRLYKAYFGVSGVSPILRVIVDGHIVDYTINDQGRANVAVGHQGREWVLELLNVTAVDFIELVPIILSRS